MSLYHPFEAPTWVHEENVTDEDIYSDLIHHRTFELTRYPAAEPTEEHYEGAWELYESCYDAAEESGYFDFDTALEDGFKMHDPWHWLNEDFYLDDENLHPYRPESLVYSEAPAEYAEDHNKILTGYMFIVDSLDAEGEQVGGPLTVWHTHPNETSYCFESRLNLGMEFDGYDCDEDDHKTSLDPEMIHVWFGRHPEGAFSAGMDELISDVAETAVEVDGVLKPEKLSKDEFMSYSKEKYEKYFKGEIAESMPHTHG